MPESKQKTPTKRWRFRFSIAFLLFLMTCVAGYFSGHQSGYQSGYDSGAKYEATISTRAYYVEDLIKPADAPADWSAKKGDFTWLIKLITTSVFADEWKKSTSDIRPFGKHASLVARCTRETHQGLAGLLQRLRDFQFKLPTDFLEKARKLVHRRKPSRQIIKSFTTISPDDHKFIEKHFHSAVSDLSNEFGTPALNATSGDPVFPEWIGAQKIALWNYGSGKLYLGLVDCRPAGEALVIGWWESEVGVLEPIVLASPVLVPTE